MIRGRVTFVVCNYEPQGNVVDHFAENVPQAVSAFVKDEKSLLRTENILQNLTYHVCNVSVPSGQPQLKAAEIREFEEECLKAHNKFRAMHGSPPLKLNRNLCVFAGEWAKVKFCLRINRLTLDYINYVVFVNHKCVFKIIVLYRCNFRRICPSVFFLDVHIEYLKRS